MSPLPLPDLSVVIPAYNEAERITPTLRRTSAWLEAQGLSYEILVVNDGSRDRTSQVVADLARELPNVHLIDSFPNRGKGHVVRLGMLTARGRHRLFMDADDSTPITELPKLLHAIENGHEVAIGSRRAPGAKTQVKPPWYRRAWSRLANRVVQAGLLDGIRDTQCGFKLFTAEAAEACFSRAKFTGWAFDLEVLALARKIGYRIAELPVEWSDDARTKISPIRDAIRITREFLKIRRAFRRGEYALPPRQARRVHLLQA
jgi:glycosyltransferase involved in cell wall biosynthesis